MGLVGPDGRDITQEDAEALVREAQQALEDEKAVPAPVPCVTAFIIYQLADGRVLATGDLNAPLVPEREPLFDELAALSGVVASDVQAHKTASLTADAVVAKQVQLQQQVMQARQAQGHLDATAQQEKARLEQALRRGR